MSQKKYKAILLDRDGVINDNRHYYVTSVDKLEIYEGVSEAIKKLNDAGLLVIVITNQGAVGKGIITEEELAEIHEYLQKCLNKNNAYVDCFIYAAEAEISETSRRKPNPHMLLEAMTKYELSPSEVVMVGDDLRDLQAAYNAGCDSILVRTGHGQKTEQSLNGDLHPIFIADTLLEAVKTLLAK